MKLGTKIIILTLVLSLYPLAAVVALFLNPLSMLYEDAVKETSQAIHDSRVREINQRAEDLAGQVAIYLKDHPGIQKQDLAKDPYFRAIATQRFGITGYSAIHDMNGISIVHMDKTLEGYDIFKKYSGLPEFLALIEKGNRTKQAAGYYQWIDSQKRYQQKFMVLQQIPDSDLVLGVTINASEFDNPFNEVSQRLRSAGYSVIIKFYIVAGIVALGAFSIALYFSSSLSGKIHRLSKSMDQFAKGDYQQRINVSGKDELSKLAVQFNKMSDQIETKTVAISRQMQRIEESEGKYKTLLEHIHDVLISWDQEEIFQFISNSFKQILGYDPEDLIGQEVMHIIHPDDRKYVQSEIQAAIGSHEPFISLITRVIDTKGDYLTFDVKIVFRYDKNGEYIGGVGLARDITREKELESETSLLSQVVRQIREGVAVVDLEGKIIFANRAWAKMHGLSSVNESVGKPIDSFFPPHAHPFLNEAQRRLDTADSVETESQQLTKDAGVFPSLVSVSRLKDESSLPIATVYISRDITNRKVLEEELQRRYENLEKTMALRTVELEHTSAKLAAAMEALQRSDVFTAEFLGKISRDLLTPLTNIIGFTGLLSASTTGSTSQLEDIKMVRLNAKHLQEVINGLLGLAQYMIDGYIPTLDEFDLGEIVDSAVEAVQPLLSGKSVQLINQFKTEVVKVFSDRYILNRTIFHLLANSIRHTEKGSVHILFHRTYSQLIVSIADTGKGISSEGAKILFDPLKQRIAKGVYKGPGFGVGLPHLKELIELLGGKLWMESKPGLGTTFYFSIPHAPENKN